MKFCDCKQIKNEGADENSNIISKVETKNTKTEENDANIEDDDGENLFEESLSNSGDSNDEEEVGIEEEVVEAER